jgi:tRNA threonylcarbamoyladenosine biosynthesis protein TsaB
VVDGRVKHVLAIDTAGPVIGVALRHGAEVRVRQERVERGAEARLVPWALELCAEAGVSLDRLDGLAVSVGPGAFTGIRVGLSTAIGLALASDRPLWPCMSLTTRAARASTTGRVLAMLDARKSRVYAAWYEAGVLQGAPTDVEPEWACTRFAGPFLATGEGARVYAAAVEAAGGTLCSDAEDPGVDQLAILGASALERGEGVDAVHVRPLYVREPDATPPKR